MKRIIQFLAIAQLTAIHVMAQQPGTLDPSFANEGVLVSDNFEGICYTLAVQQDGKIVAAGTDISFPEKNLIARYNSDGSQDYSFGDSGLVYTTFSGRGYILSMQILEDGKILTSGNCDDFKDIGLARYMPDGRLDSSFGVNGKVTADFGATESFGYMDLQSDGKIIVTGGYDKPDEIFIARFLPDGTLDESFGTSGSVITTFSSYIRVTGIVIQTDDRILVEGIVDYRTGESYTQVSRYMPDGTVDMSFGKNGIANAYFPKNEMDAYAIALQQDGKIVVAGYGFNVNNLTSGFGLARLQTNGAIDKTFGIEGLAITAFDSSGSEAKTLQIQKDGKIIAAGSRYCAYPCRYYQFALARYNTDGSLDSAFGVNGLQHTEPYPFYIAYSSALQEDGKIVLGGLGGAPFYFVFARYFGGDGVLPVKYTSISAKQNKNNVVLTWQTTGESSNNFFTIEHAANEYDFSQIARVTAQSSINLAQQYSYTDKTPLQGNNFYRIKQTDANGNYNYSKTVAVNFAGKDYIQLYPNPAKDLLTVKGLRNNEMNKLFLYDLQGKLIQQFTTQSEVYSFSVSNIAAGTYMLQVQNSNGVSSHRFVKK